jgi:hypothetical protein
MRGMLTRKQVSTKLKNIPHIIKINLRGAEGLADTNYFLTPIPDAYVLVNVIQDLSKLPKKDTKSKKYKFLSSAQTSVFPGSYNPQWNEDLRLTIMGSGYLVLNVFSKNTFTGDFFLGQAVIDIEKHPQLYFGEVLAIRIPINPPIHAIYSRTGEKLEKPAQIGQGSFNLSVHVPSIFSNMCGWFSRINTNLFGDVYGKKMWVILDAGVLYCYDSQFENYLIEQFSCNELADMEEIMCHKLEIAIEAISITFKPVEPEIIGRNMLWAWGSDVGQIKGLWRRALIKNHGSGINIKK